MFGMAWSVLGPCLTETLDTPDCLVAAGMRWIADWVADDLPCRLKTRCGEVLTMPSSVELNDSPVQMMQRHGGSDFAVRTLARVDRLPCEAVSDGPLGGAWVMGFAIHSSITGVPHRISMLEGLLDALTRRDGLVFMQGDEIAHWYLTTGCHV
jgi:allantoinase